MDTDTAPTVISGPPPAEEPPPVAEAGDPPGSPGATWIADSIVAKVAASAAREVNGVEDLRSGTARRGWVRASERRQGGASVKVADGAASIDLRLVVRDAVAIPALVDEVRARVIHRVEFATGLTVTTVDVGVVDVVPAAAVPEPAAPEEPDAEATASEG